jgi:hypothetical protein
MRDSKKAMLSLTAGSLCPAWSAGFGQVAMIDPQLSIVRTGGDGEGGMKMKILGNAAAVLFALFIMGGLILAQRDSQNSFGAAQASATTLSSTGVPAHSGEYKVVLK